MDEAGLVYLMARQRKAGVSGVVAAGTTGEASTLTAAERETLLRRTLQEAGELTVIAGVGTNDTLESQRRIARAQALGVSAALVVTPYYNKPSARGLEAHFEAVSEAAPGLPLILYTVPGRTGGVLPLDVAEQLSHHPAVVAIKDATGDLAYGARLFQRCAGRVGLLSGDDPTALAHWALGGRGSISVISNLAPMAFQQTWLNYESGQLDAARRRFYRLLPLIDGLFIESNPAPLKAALAWASEGAISSDLRLPLVGLEAESEVRLRDLYQRWRAS